MNDRRLSHPIGMQGGVGILYGRALFAVKLAGYRATDPGCQLLKRSRQSVGFQFGRIKASGNVANLNNGFVDETGQFVQLTGVTGSLPIQVTCECLYGEGRPEKVLAQVVMHLPSNPLLFAFLRTQKRVFQELEFGDVADQERTPAVSARVGHAQILTTIALPAFVWHMHSK